jgi:hypothetical protein
MSIKVNCLGIGNVPKVEAIDIKEHIKRCEQENMNMAKKFATGGVVPFSLWGDFTYETKPRFQVPKIKKVIFNDPVTVIIWADDSRKTVVKARDGDTFNKEVGLAFAIAKKALGNKYDYYNAFKKWCKENG